MPMKPAPKKVYRTANGKTVDTDLLRQRNELTPAVGNSRVNARWDELGPGGKIVRKREEVLADYYEDNPNAKISTPSPAPVVEEKAAQPKVKQQKQVNNESTGQD